MKDLEQIQDRDIEATRIKCQKDKQPYCYWDEKEVDKAVGLPFPYLTADPEGWEKRAPGVPPLLVCINEPAQVEKFKILVKKILIITDALADTEIGFAFIHKVGNLHFVQTYSQPVAKSPAFEKELKADKYENEKVLADDHPIKLGYLYVARGAAVRNTFFKKGTIEHLKHKLGVTEIKHCSLERIINEGLQIIG